MIGLYGPRSREGKRQMSRKISSAGMGLLAAVIVAGAAACSSSPPPPVTTSFHGAAAPSGSWPYPNGDLANTRDAAGSAISSANVASLREAWSFKLTGTAAAGVGKTGAFAAAPVVVNGVVYIRTWTATSTRCPSPPGR